jgi:hypothetical protein
MTNFGWGWCENPPNLCLDNKCFKGPTKRKWLLPVGQCQWLATHCLLLIDWRHRMAHLCINVPLIYYPIFIVCAWGRRAKEYNTKLRCEKYWYPEPTSIGEVRIGVHKYVPISMQPKRSLNMEWGILPFFSCVYTSVGQISQIPLGIIWASRSDLLRVSP